MRDKEHNTNFKFHINPETGEEFQINPEEFLRNTAKSPF